jgi:hypothetical protein
VRSLAIIHDGILVTDCLTRLARLIFVPGP